MAAPTVRLGVLGWPVAHSRSPAMQRAALNALGLEHWTYQKLPAPPEVFADVVAGLPGAGFLGANVTLPHKEAALALATHPTPRAQAIGAANTLQFNPDGSIWADNTDAPGLLTALDGFDPAGRTALVLGAGGSARAVAWALVQAGADVSIWNRTPERAVALAAAVGARVAGEHPSADLLVNSTQVGLDGGPTPFKHLPIEADDLAGFSFAVDMVYSPHGSTVLLDSARQAGCAVVDGLEVLVRQGALALEAWTGLDVPLDAMRRGARMGEGP